MDDCVTYTSPEVVDYGSFGELTADVDQLNVSLGVVKALVGASVMSVPLVPGGSGDSGGTLTTQGTGTGGGGTTTPTDGLGGLQSDPGGTLGDAGTGGSADPGGDTGGGDGGGSGSGSGGGGGGRLPFTGLSVVLIAAVGAGLATTGASLRARLRRAGWSPR